MDRLQRMFQEPGFGDWGRPSGGGSHLTHPCRRAMENRAGSLVGKAVLPVGDGFDAEAAIFWGRHDGD